MSSLLAQWEADHAPAWRRRMNWVKRVWPRVARLGLVAVLGFGAGVQFATAPLVTATSRAQNLEGRAATAEWRVAAREGELDLFRLEIARLQEILAQSTRHGIPADLAAAIYDIAISEGIEPQLGFGLVAVESEFTARAVSHKGAVGLTQVMPSTAFEMDPSLDRNDLFERDTNLRLGFRYLRHMLRKYDGDLRMALLAYNRGPGTVDSIRGKGRDPGNGYARAVLRGAEVGH
ncbi:MAG: lytic transglycosylase domain-containing protein [Longimicrobiales bacterium]